MAATHNLFRRGSILLPLFLFLWGCTPSSEWLVSHQKGSQKEFNSSRLSYPIRDKVNGIGVEMVYVKNSLRTYLEVHSQTIPPYKNNSKEALVRIKTAEKTIHGIAHRHEGGQRATLPSHLQEIVVDNLIKGSKVTLELIGYSTTLEPRDFALAYQEMQKAPINIPIQLPFKI
jgi:hypothetical protein